MEKIIGNEQEIKNLLNKESIDELYEFFLEKDNTLTMEEFDNEVYDILENYSKTSEEIDQDTLEKISGGKADFLKKTLATSLSALSIGYVVTSPMLAAGTSHVRNGSRSIARSAKDKIKGGFTKIGKWFSAHKRAAAIAGGAVGAAAVGAIILTVAIKHKNADNTSDVANSGQQGDSNITSTNTSATLNSEKSRESASSSAASTAGITSAASGAGTASVASAASAASTASTKSAKDAENSASTIITTSPTSTASDMRAADTKSDASLSASSDSTGDGGKIIPQEPSDIELKDIRGSSSSAADASPAVTTASTEVKGDSDSSSSSSPGLVSRVIDGVKQFFGRDSGDQSDGKDTDKTEKTNPGTASEDLSKSQPKRSAGTLSPLKKGDESTASKKGGMSIFGLTKLPETRH